MTKKRTRLKSGFSLGGEQAETDSLLELAFFESGDYQSIESRTDRRCFVVGRTGAGKSAALQHLEETKPGNVIRINPENLSMPYITDLQVFRYLDSLDVHLDLLWIALWKHVILVEILRKRYRVDTPAAKQNVLTALMEKVRQDPAKVAALKYLDEFQGRFWCEADVRVREITDNFTRRIETEGKLGLRLPMAEAGLRGAISSQSSSASRAEEAERFQRIVNDTQLARLNKMLEILRDDVLARPQDHLYIVIDDLDRNWVDERLANDLIRCLFQTVLDLQRVQQLKVLVALRTNIFEELDFGQRGGQEEKFRSLVLQIRWTRSDLVSVLDDRVRIAGPEFGSEVQSLRELLPAQNRSRGNPLDYMLDRTLLRPRDAIAFANECLAMGGGKTRLTWDDMKSAEREYSAKRLLALRDEWKRTYPGIDRVFEKFRRAPARMDKTEFETRLVEAMLLLADGSFPGVLWLTELAETMWSPGAAGTWFEQFQPLSRFLYSLGFIGCSEGAAPRFYLDDPLYLDSETHVDRVTVFYVHRAYHSALDIHQSGVVSASKGAVRSRVLDVVVGP